MTEQEEYKRIAESITEEEIEDKLKGRWSK